MSVTLYERQEWSLSIIYRPHYDLAVATLDAALERGDAAKVRSLGSSLSDSVKREGQLPAITISREERWREPLKDAYRRDERRLSLHGVALISSNLSELLARLESQMSDDHPAAGALREALLIEMDALMTRWGVNEPKPEEFEDAWSAQLERAPRLDDLMAPSEYSPLLRDLQRCRRELFKGAAPPLTLLHCPSLKSSGRGGGSPERRVVAVSFEESQRWVFCQALHEEVHAITDRQARGDLATRETRAGAQGSEVHRALEERAMKRATELIKSCRPQRLQDDLNWRRAHGLSSVRASAERAQQVTEDLSKRLDASRRRLITLFIIALASAWVSATLHRGLGLSVACCWALLFSALCYLPSAGGWIARRRVEFGVYDLDARQRFALTASAAIQVAAIYMQ